MKPFVPNVIRGQVEDLQSFDLLGNASADVANTSVLEIVVPHVQDAEGVVRAQDGAQMLAILWPQMVAPQPQLLQILVELHSSHCKSHRHPHR